MVNLKRTLPLLLAAAALLAACAGAAPEGDTGPLVLQDGSGRQLVLGGPAERIVSLAPSNTELIFAVGAGHHLIGRDELSDYPPEAAEVQSIGSTFGSLNTEAIVNLSPDLVLAAGITPPEQIQAIEDLGIPVFVIANPDDFDGLYTNLRLVGQLTDHGAEADELIRSLQDRVDAVRQAVQGASPVLVYYEVDATDPSAPWTTGSGTFQDFLIRSAAAENVAGDLEGWWQISQEELLARAPEVLVYETGAFIATTVDSIAARPGWEALPAVAEGRVYPIDADLTSRPGPRLVDAFEALARLLHPERFDG